MRIGCGLSRYRAIVTDGVRTLATADQLGSRTCGTCQEHHHIDIDIDIEAVLSQTILKEQHFAQSRPGV